MSSIGDVLMATPVARALREAFPQAHLTWAIDRRCADVVEGNPYLDDLLVTQRDSWQLVDLLSYWTQTRRHPAFDWTIDLHGLARSALVTLASRAPVRVGLANAREGSRLAYNRVVQPPPTAVHRVDFYAAALEEIGIPVPHREMLLPCGPEHAAAARALLTEAAPGPGPLVALSLTAGRMQKCWLVERFAALADRLIARHGCRVVVLGSAADRPYVQRMQAAMEQQAADLSGRIDLKVAAEVLRACALFVSADTGPMHIAAAMKTPTVALFGPTEPEYYGPYGTVHTIIRHHCRCAPHWRRPVCQERECMRAITVEEVEAAAVALLARASAPQQ
ncbi:MAG: glycosyltransferase family 9 protein [Armatimonadetes bacterium]|nr:glycosyltransferase family 9 protein [Armatimonadota bacterium]